MMAQVGAATAPYTTDFEAGIGTEWSLTTLDATHPAAFTKFSGRFANETQTLTLEGLTPGQSYTVGFDLYIIDSWDGNSGGDTFIVEANGEEKFRHTFANYNGNPPGASQTFPEEGGRALMGFWEPMYDAIYRDLKITFTPAAATATVSFRGFNLQPISDESWGVDNVWVKRTADLPPPSFSTANIPAAGGTTALALDRILLRAPGALEATAAGNAANYKLREAGADQNFGSGDDQLLEISPSFDGFRNVTLMITAHPLQPGKYRVEASGMTLTDGTAVANLLHAFNVAHPTLGRIESLSNDTLPTATVLPVTETPTGTTFYTAFGTGFLTPDNNDYWRFDAEAGDRILIHVESETSGYPYIYLYNSSEGHVASTGYYNDNHAALGHTFANPGTYYIKTWSPGWATKARYEMRLDLSRGIQMETENNDESSQANALQLAIVAGNYSAKVAGAIEGNDAAGDYYRLGTLNVGNALGVTTSYPVGSSLNGAAIRLRVYKEGVTDPVATQTGGSLNFTATEDGFYFLQVHTDYPAWRAQYIATIGITDGVPPVVVASSLPAEGTVTTTVTDRFTLEFSEELQPSTVNAPGNYELKSAGADNNFDTADDVAYTVTPQNYSVGLSASYIVTDGPLQPGRYRFTVKTAIQDRGGNPFTSAYVQTFTFNDLPPYVLESRDNDALATATPITAVDPAGNGIKTAAGRGNMAHSTDYDYFKFQASAGEVVQLACETPGAVPSTGLSWYVFRENGSVLFGFYPNSSGVGQEKGVIPEDGTYYLRPQWWHAYTGEYRFRVTLAPPGSQLETEGNGDFASANTPTFTLSGNTSSAELLGYISLGNDVDHYRIGHLAAGAQVAVNWRKPSDSAANIKLELCTADGQLVIASAEGASSLSYQVPAEGANLFYLRVTDLAGGGLFNQYFVTVALTDAQVPTVTEVTLPQEGSTNTFVPAYFEVSFSEDMLASTINDPNNFELRSAGADGIFGNTDDSTYTLVHPVYGFGLTVPFSYSDGPLQPGKYRFTIKTGVNDLGGNSISAAYVRNFEVAGVPGFVLESRGNAGLLTATSLSLAPGTKPSGTYLVENAWGGAGAQPWSVATGDLNKDGRMDVVTANYNGGNVSIFLRNADGSYASPLNLPSGSGAVSIAVADFNADNNPDVAAANYHAGNLSVFLGNGDGTFQTAANVASANNPRWIVASDINNDAKVDLVVAQVGNETVGIHAGKGDGTFEARQDIATQGADPVGVWVEDMNGDGLKDVITANQASRNISVLLATAVGEFGTPQLHETGNSPRMVAVADFNQDSVKDIAVVNGGQSFVSVLLGNGSGGFAPQAQVEAYSADPYDLIAGDFNGDGHADVATANYGRSDVTFVYGNGDGTFDPYATMSVSGNPINIGAADLDGDGLQEIVTANYYGNNISILKGRFEEVLAEDPSGSGILYGAARGYISDAQDVDFWSFSGKAGDTVQLAIENPGHPLNSVLHYQIWNHNGTSLPNASYTGDTYGWGQSPPLVLPSDGHYFIRIAQWHGYYREYRFRLIQARNPHQIERENNNDWNNVNAVSFLLSGANQSARIAGHFHLDDTAGDYYSLGNLSAGTAINLSLARPGFSKVAAVASIYNGLRVEVARSPLGAETFQYIIPEGQDSQYSVRLEHIAPSRVGDEGPYLTFDGSGDYVNTGAWTPGSQWTVEAWVRASGWPWGRRGIVGGLAGCLDWGLVQHNGNDNGVGEFGVVIKPPGPCSAVLTSGIRPTPGQWYYLAASSDGATARLYVDGVLVNSGAVEPNYVGTSQGTWIGGEVCCGQYFGGAIDDVRIWNRPLSAAEISANMSRQVSANEAGLAGMWGFEEGADRAIADATAGAHNGTVTGDAAWRSFGPADATPLGFNSQYILNIDLSDTAPPTVTSTTLPAEGGSASFIPYTFNVVFSEDMLASSITDGNNYELRSAGVDNIFGNADDEIYSVLPGTYTTGLTASYQIGNGPLQNGNYRFTVKTGVKDRSGTAMEAAYVRAFQVVGLPGYVRESRNNNTIATASSLHPGATELPEQIANSGLFSAAAHGNIDAASDDDYWSFTGKAGDYLEVAVEVPGRPSGSQLYLEIVKANGARVTDFHTTGNGWGNSPRTKADRLILPEDGTYYVKVENWSQYWGEYRLRVTVAKPPGALEYENHFYGNQDNDAVGVANDFNFYTEANRVKAKMAGFLGAGDRDGDFFAIRRLVPGTIINAAVTKPATSTANFTLQLLNATGTSVASPTEGSVQFTVPTEAGSDFFLKVTTPSAELGLLSQYLLTVDLQDTSAPSVTGDSLPAAGSATTALISYFSVDFSKDMAAATVSSGSNFDLRAAGGDGLFGTTDDEIYAVSALPYTGGLRVNLLATDGPLQPGSYRFQVKTGMQDRFGNALASTYEKLFSVTGQAGAILESRSNDTKETANVLALTEELASFHSALGRGNLQTAQDQDWWRFTGTAGDKLVLAAENPGAPSSSLLRYVIVRPNGSSLSGGTLQTGDRGYGEVGALTLPESGDYYVRVERHSSYDYRGEYNFRVNITTGTLVQENENNGGVSSATALTLVQNGNARTASSAGFISVGTDLDYFRLPGLTSGSTVFLATRVPSWSSFVPNVSIYNAANGYMVEAGSGRSGDGVAEVRILADGDYYAVVRGGEGASGINTLYALDVQVLPTGSVAFPNLQVVSVTPPTGNNLVSGQPVPIGFVVRNVGSVDTPSASWTDRAVISQNVTLGDGDDLQIGIFPHTGILVAGNDYAVNESVNLPHGISGTFYLIVQTDFANSVNEFVLEGDNITPSSSTFNVTLAPYPDLKVEGLAASVGANNQVTISWNTANRGNAPVSTAFKERVFVRNATTGTTLSNVERDVTAALAVGATLPQTATVNATVAGNYQVIVTTDSSDRIYEFNASGHANAELNSAETTARVLADFTVTLASNPSTGGTVTGAGTFKEGTSVTVRATPVTTQLPYQFANWTENGVIQSTEANYTFVLTKNRQLVANFSLPTYQVTVAHSPIGGGTVTGTGSYNHGATANLKATANFGYRFNRWTENGTIIGTSEDLSLTVTANRSIVAHYNEAHLQHVVTTESSPAGVSTVTGAGTFSNGQSTTITAAASVTKDETIYTFKRYLLNGEAYGTANSFSKTFATTDPTNMLFTAVYDSRSQFPLVSNVVMNLVNPVPRTTNLIITVQFNRSMKTSVEPVVRLSNSATGAIQPTVPSGGTWVSVANPNDTYRTPPITIGAGMDGTNKVLVSLAQDLDSAVMKPAQVHEVLVDATLPGISNVQVVRGSGSAVVTWNTDEPASSQVEFGATTAYGRKTSLSSSLVTAHRVVVSGLTPQTTYQYRVASRDRAGNERLGVNGSFTTLPAPDLSISQISVTPAQIQSGSALAISWTLANSGVGPASGAWFDHITVRNNTVGKLLLEENVRYDAAVAGDIASGSSKPGTINLLLPEGADGAGELVITVAADYYNNVQEGSTAAEGNNSLSVTRTSALKAYPDLVVQNIVVTPSNPESGQNLTITWVDRNTGNAPAAGVIADNIIIRNTTTGEWLGSQTLVYDSSAAGNSAVAAGAGLNRQFAFRLPDGSRGAGNISVEISTDTSNGVFEYNAQQTAETNNRTTLGFAATQAQYPDLVIKSITVPATATAGASLQVAYEAENRGAKATSGQWTDYIFLSEDPVLGGDQYLASVSYSDSIAAGAVAARTATVNLPQFGTGRRWIVIRSDASNTIFESNENNNAAIDDQWVEVPSSLQFTLSRATAPEHVGNSGVYGTITRNSGTQNDLTVTLASNNPQEAVPPASVIIGANQISATFPINVVDDQLVDGAKAVIFTAAAAGFQAVTAELQVTDDDSAVLSLTSTTLQVRENTTFQVQVARNTPVAEPLAVTLASTDPTRIGVPPSITIPAGQRNVTFTGTVIDNQTENRPTRVSVTAASAGYQALPLLLEVLDDDLPSLTIQLDKSVISEGVANPAAFGRVTRTPVTSRPLFLLLQSSDQFAARVPLSVTIAPNEASVDFAITAVDDELVDFPQEAGISAFAADSMFNWPIEEGSGSAILTVTDDDGPTLKISLDSEVVSERGTSIGRVHRNTDPAASLVVNLRSEDTTEATVPVSVTIPAGQRTASFTITGANDNTPDGIQPASIVASANTFTEGRATINVSDVDLPDLRVSAINVPANGLTGGSLSISWTVRNEGLSTANASWVDRVYLCTTPDGANLQAVGQFFRTANLPVGEAYERSSLIPLPSSPGTYYVMVVTDSDGAVNEGAERNNTSFSSTGMTIAPAYRATVATEVTSVPQGTPIPLTGRAFKTGSGDPAPFALVTVRLNVKGTRRIIDLRADASGNFQHTFYPLPNEAGHITIGADHPGVEEDPLQDAFDIHGIRFAEHELTLRAFPLSDTTGELTVQNLADLPASGLTYQVEGLPQGVTLSFNSPANLGPLVQQAIGYTLGVGNLTTELRVRARVKATTTQGAVAYLPLNLTVAPHRPSLAANPGVLTAGMTRGKQKSIEFTLSNNGAAATGPIEIRAPGVPWLSVSTPVNLPSLAPGELTRVVVNLTPAADLPLNRYDGSLYIVSTSGADLNVPFSFRAISEAKGDLKIEVTDEYTFYVAGAPKVEGATVTLVDPLTGDRISEKQTDASGVALFTDIQEGSYQLTVTAPKHSTYRAPITIQPGVTTELTTFIDRQTVSYRWTVVPTQVEDTYKVVLESVFEAEVPIPVVTIDNPLMMPLVVVGRDTQMEIRLTNHGLIAAERVSVVIPQHPDYEIESLVDVIDVLPAKSSVSIPVIIRAKPTAQFATLAALESRQSRQCGTTFTGCQVYPKLQVKWSFVCGPDRRWRLSEASVNPVCVDESCWDKIKDLLKDKAKNPKDILEWKDSLCELAAILASCVDECLGSIVKTACGIATRDVMGAIGGAAGLGQCICPSLPSLPVPSGTSNPPPIDLWTGSWGGGSGSFDFPVPAPIGWDYSPNCNPGDTVGGGFGGDSLDRQAATQPGAVCARVRIRIEQEAVITRAAFLGTLELDNGHTEIDLTEIQLSIDIRDEFGATANDKFAVKGPDLTNLSAVDGTGILLRTKTGVAKYTFIPNRMAAPEGPKVYRIGGTLRYKEGTEVIEVPLVADTITVYPDPVLNLVYFQQRDVYADDPFTDEVEPSEPFDLGLLVKNRGKGAALNFRITSAQPEIIENEKGLLIDFKIIGTQIGGEEVAPTLTANLGRIEPGQARTAAWKLISTLQGKFVEYTATFEHVSSLGDAQLSLIDSVEIHELIHSVRAARQADDAMADFLTNDDPDPNNTPDTLWLSDGTVAPVNLGTNPQANGPVTAGDTQVQVTVQVASGFAYFKMQDPGAGYRLFRVTRADGKEILVGPNAWTTDRSFPSANAGAVRENLVHLFDHHAAGGTVTYTLYYRSSDAVAPVLTDIVDIDPVVQSGAVAGVEVLFSEDIDLTTFTYEDIVLSRNGGANLITPDVIVSRLEANKYRITGLSGLTGAEGNYELTVNGTGIEDFGGNATEGVASVRWSVAGTVPVVAMIQAVSPALRNAPVPSLDVTFSEPIKLASFDQNDIVLSVNGGPDLISEPIAIALVSGSTYRISGLGSLTAEAGEYSLTISAAAVQDTADNNGTGQLTMRWAMDTTSPTAVLETVNTNPRNIVVPALEVQFSEPIDERTFDFSDITLTRNGGANLVTTAVKVTKLSATTYRISEFSWVSGQEGEYILSVNTTGIRDLAGNPGLGTTSSVWKMDTTKPLSATNLAIIPDLGSSNTDGRTSTNEVVFTGRVTGTNVTVRLFDVTNDEELGVVTLTDGVFAKSLSLAQGRHRLRARVIDDAANVSEDGILETYIDLAAPTATFAEVSPDPRDAAVTHIDFTFSEEINTTTFTRDDLKLTRNGGANLVTGGVSIQYLGNNVYRISGLQTLTDVGGLYVLTVDMAGVEDIAGNKGKDTVTESWRRTGANTAPVLTAIPNKLISAESLLTHTNVATDFDIPVQVLRYSLGSGAPTGAAINAETGVFTWRPTRAQAPGVYTITVVVTDNGIPPLADSKQFVVTVTDYAEVRLGRSVTRINQRGAVPVEVFGTAPVGSFSFLLNLRADYLTSLTVDALVPEVGSATIQKISDTQYRVNVSARAGASFQGRVVPVEIGYNALPDRISAFVHLNPSEVAVAKTDTTAITRLFSTSGRVVVVGTQALLEALEDGGTRSIILYGPPNQTYQIQRTQALGPNISWTNEIRVTLPGLSELFEVAPNTNALNYYRAFQIP